MMDILFKPSLDLNMEGGHRRFGQLRTNKRAFVESHVDLALSD